MALLGRLFLHSQGHLQTSRGLPCQVRSAPESRHRCSRPTSRLRAVCRRASQRRHLRFTLDACVREVPAHLKACSCLWNSTDRGTKATAAIFMREAAVRQSNDNGACSGWPKVLGPAVQNERAQIAKGGGLHLVRTRPRAPFDGDLMRLVVGGRDTPGTKVPLCETISILTTPTAGQSRERSANVYERT
jgi:hypothetical protein